jgi:hypothetical protein
MLLRAASASFPFSEGRSIAAPPLFGNPATSQLARRPLRFALRLAAGLPFSQRTDPRAYTHIPKFPKPCYERSVHRNPVLRNTFGELFLLREQHLGVSLHVRAHFQSYPRRREHDQGGTVVDRL